MFLGFVYLGLGILFTLIAGYSGQDSGWSTLTIIYAIIAIIDFGAGVRHIQRHRLKKSMEEKK